MTFLNKKAKESTNYKETLSWIELAKLEILIDIRDLLNTKKPKKRS